jgi:hypothetical protein
MASEYRDDCANSVTGTHFTRRYLQGSGQESLDLAVNNVKGHRAHATHEGFADRGHVAGHAGHANRIAAAAHHAALEGTHGIATNAASHGRNGVAAAGFGRAALGFPTRPATGIDKQHFCHVVTSQI